MTTLKLGAGKSSRGLLAYLAEGKRKDPAAPSIDDERRQLLYSSLGETNIEDIEKSFARTRKLHGKNEGRRVFHVSLNFNGADSKVQEMNDNQLLRYAQEFAEAHCPGHSYAVFKHSDTQNLHLHLAINSVSEDGVKFQSPPRKLHDGMAKLQQMDAALGLKVTLSKDNELFVPTKDKITAREIHMKDRTNGEVLLWKEDLKHRILSVSPLSKDFDDFRSKLLALGVKTDIRGKNEVITYSFTDADGKQRKARDTSLGADYGRGIREQIQTNARNDGVLKTREANHRRDERAIGDDGRILDGNDRREKIHPNGILEGAERSRDLQNPSSKGVSGLERAVNNFYETEHERNVKARRGDKVPELTGTYLLQAGGPIHTELRQNDETLPHSKRHYVAITEPSDRLFTGNIVQHVHNEPLKKVIENGNSIHKDNDSKALEPFKINDSRRVTDAHRLLRQGISRVDLQEQGRLASRVGRFKESFRRGFNEVRDAIERAKIFVMEMIAKREKEAEKKRKLEREHFPDRGPDRGRGGPGLGR